MHIWVEMRLQGYLGTGRPINEMTADHHFPDIDFYLAQGSLTLPNEVLMRSKMKLKVFPSLLRGKEQMDGMDTDQVQR